ncbi:DUF5134 domain-containing protein [Kitasatospora sp. MAP5-34]|uniref:DUF5134 domain-containing protein n=1 Tax=Kitasatospora sp. MAP5-34 TaxID=3035102 RepID=UPI002473CDFB|nr:DUF5134 domain-containing protein [Kitasatospora sp. MAP5-34]MDH6579744.1 hypothetical protein [Kitasatospora sp. MAP5-34]
MHGPAVVTWLLAGLTAGSGLYCLTRLRSSAAACALPGAGTGRWPARESDAAEALMGLGMAGMALWPTVLWGWLYGLLAVALLAAVAGPGTTGLRAHRLHHGIGALAMTYMALTMAGGSEHLHHHGAPVGLPLLTGALLVYFGCYALWTGSRLLTVSGGVVGPVPVGARGAGGAGVSRACRLAMGVGMFAMLLTM